MQSAAARSRPYEVAVSRGARGSSRLRLLAGLVAVVAVTTACGSTVQPGRGAGDAGATGDPLASTPTTGSEEAELSFDASAAADPSAPDDASTTAHQSAPAGSATDTTAPPASAPGGGASGSGTASPSAGAPDGQAAEPADGPEVAAGEISVGVLYADDGEGVLAAFGGTGTRGDERAEYETLIEDVNARGGIAGRELVPVYYMTPFAGSDPEGDLQAACAHFTQDNDVFAVLTSRAGGTTESFKRCLEEAGVVHIQANFSFAGEETYVRNPHYIEPANIALNRSAANYVPTLGRQDYFSGWNAATGQPGQGDATVGIVTYDTPAYDAAVDGVLVPALERAGVEVGDISRVNAAGSAGDQSQEIANAVLRFRQRGVDHVIFFAGGANPPLLFLNQAASQGYRPRYAFTSQELPSLVLELGVFSDPDGQLRGAVGMGWWPAADLPLGGDPFADREQTQRCLQVLQDDGHEHPTALRTALALIHCDVVNFLEVALEATGPNLTRASFREGLNRVGSSFTPRFTIATTVSAQRRDGVAAISDWQYDVDCSCFRYVGQPREAR